MTRIRRLTVLMALVLSCTSLAAPASAQRDMPPEKGGQTYSLGMPPVYKGRSGFEMMWHRPQNDSDLAGFYNLGLSRDLGSPVVGIAALRAEGYLGANAQDFDGGGRFMFEIPSFHFGVGVDFLGSDEAWDMLYQLNLPIRRGGLFGRGSTLAIRWLPTRDQSFGIGVGVPLWGRNIGETRPKSDNVNLVQRKPQRINLDIEGHELDATLANLRKRAAWVARLSQPFAEPEGAKAEEAMAPVLAGLRAHIDSVDSDFPGGHTLPAEIDAYHATLDLAFSLAFGDQGISDRGREVSAKARAILLDEVLIPYNYLLGQRKRNDSLISMIAVAQTEFAFWAMAGAKEATPEIRKAFLVYQTLCDIMEENRAELRDRWKDSRFVWLPLHYALKPDQHDTQAELNDLIARAADQPWTSENRIWYVVNEQFQWEMVRSVREAEDYHVLWIHDFRGFNGQGKPDGIAYAQTLNYLEAMIERVDAYDESGKLPQYFILLDQHYFEINKARLWLRLLSDPLNYEMDLPKGFEEWEERLHETQERLRAAVQGSVLLSLGASQYGGKWLKNRIKVHVNITNPADPSFWSWHIAGIIPIPDNMMRDHRKIAFYDITEEDPFKGMAMFTGMGIGEHYVGANWEDRAIMIQGPGALAVKDAARELMLAQGYEPDEVPFPLRVAEKAPDYDAILASENEKLVPDWLGDRGSVVQLHSETGFYDKPINAAKAVLYSLMPPGSVLKVPDSLWQSYVYGSLLAGSAQRGCQVMVIAPTADSAPSNAAPTLARAHGLMGRLIVFSIGMDDLFEREGGILKVGLYSPRQGVGDLVGRFEQVDEVRPAWLSRVYPETPEVDAVLDNVAAQLDSIGFEEVYIGEGAEKVKPKIHLKANFFASGAAWRKLMERPELGAIVRAHIEYLAHQVMVSQQGEVMPDIRTYPEALAEAWLDLAKGLLGDLTPVERDELVYYLSVGSVNMDYRSLVMDGEVMILLSGLQSMHGFLDFLILPGLCEWVDTTEELDALLPPPSGFVRGMAGLMKLSL